MSDLTAEAAASTIQDAAAGVARMGYWQGVWRRLRRDRTTMICCAILLLILLAATFAPVLAPDNPLRGSIMNRLQPVGTPGHILGTDELGRDMLSRLLYGGRLSWFIGITPVVLAFFIGGLLGIVAGFAGGRINMLVMRTTDIFYAFPSVLLAVAISGALGQGITNTILSLSLVFIPPMIRVAESVTTSVRNLEYVAAARASGAGSLSIVRLHILPNVLGPISVYATTLIAVSMTLASGLSFIGLGVSPPIPEWGLMLNTLRSAIYSQPLLATLPGICILVTSTCFNLVSDGLRAAMDVRR